MRKTVLAFAALFALACVLLGASQVAFKDNFERGASAGPQELGPWLPPWPPDWEIAQDGDNHFLHMIRAGYGPGVPRRPLNYVLLRDRCFTDFTLSVRARRLQRSLMLVFGYQDTLHFNYAHLSVDTGTKQPVHNGIFRVDGGERFRIDDPNRPAALPDQQWHTVKVLRKGDEVAVFMDGSSKALLQITGKLFPYGRVGLGSFDETADFDDFTITGTPTNACNSAVMKLPVLADTAIDLTLRQHDVNLSLLERLISRFFSAPQSATEPALQQGTAASIRFSNIDKQPLVVDFPGLRQWDGYEVKRAALCLHTAGTIGPLAVGPVMIAWDEKGAHASDLRWALALSLPRLTLPAARPARAPEAGWWRVPIDPSLVARLIAGQTYGIALGLESDGGMVEIDSRESNFIPYLELALTKKK